MKDTDALKAERQALAWSRAVDAEKWRADAEKWRAHAIRLAALTESIRPLLTAADRMFADLEAEEAEEHE